MRTVAIALALTGAVDPSWTRERQVPAYVQLHVVEPIEQLAVAASVERQLAEVLAGDVTFNADADRSAVVWIGDRVEQGSIPEDVPVSTVRMDSAGPNVGILSVSEPAVVPAGWKTTVTAVIEARG
jgi:hypothetical protein